MYHMKLRKLVFTPLIVTTGAAMGLVLLYLVLPARNAEVFSGLRFFMSYSLLRTGMNPTKVEAYMVKYYSTAGRKMESELSNEYWRRKKLSLPPMSLLPREVVPSNYTGYLWYYHDFMHDDCVSLEFKDGVLVKKSFSIL